jgi:hypothetical protein
MKNMWKGVEVYDMYKKESITLRGRILCTITDLPGGHYMSR